jgi:hypothetical protein
MFPLLSKMPKNKMLRMTTPILGAVWSICLGITGRLAVLCPRPMLKTKMKFMVTFKMIRLKRYEAE